MVKGGMIQQKKMVKKKRKITEKEHDE